MKKGLLLLLLLLLVSSVFAQNFPDKPVNYVSDFAGILSPADEARLNVLAQSVEEETSAEVAIVTVESLEGETATGYAVKLFERWGIGKKDVDNGLLILVAPKEREFRIEVGYGLEPSLPDSVAGRIGRDILIPAFREERYGSGLFDAVSEVAGYIKEDPSIVSKYPKSVSYSSGSYFILVILFVFVIVAPLVKKFTKNLDKKKQVFAKIGVGGGIFALLLYFGVVTAFIFIVYYLISVFVSRSPYSAIYLGGFGGRRGGGFSGFGGGLSGGGGFSGRW